MASLDAIVILPDWQIPLHDESKIRKVAEFVWKFQPKAIGHVGDVTDSLQISRWARGLRAEFDGGLEGGFEKTRELLAYYRQGYDGPIHIVKSNHDERLETAIEQRLPALAGLTVMGHKLNIQNVLQLDTMGITWHETPFEIAPHWTLAHGDEGKLSQVPGATALGLTGEMNSNVVSGHTHRAGIAWTTKGIGSARVPVAGMEVGHMMGIEGAEYLGRARLNNWGNAFGILWVYKENRKPAEVYPELVPISPSGNFIVNGERY